MKTFFPKKQDVEKKWYIVDAKDKVLGRLSSRIALVLLGKNKPTYTPYLDTGDNVIVINANQVCLTGKKLDEKVYYRHTGYPGGLRSTSAKELSQTKPEKIIQFAVKGMLPKNKLGQQVIKNLKVYANDTHPHAAQKPVSLEL